MIDIEPQIFTEVAEALMNKFPNISVYGESDLVPASYPFVTIEESNNVVYTKGSTTCDLENFAQLTYTVNVYSNKRNGKKSEAKAIVNVIDTILSNKGFIRTIQQPMRTDDITVHRVVLIYSGVVGKYDNYIYGS